MSSLKDVFDLAHAEIRDIRAQGGEVIVVPLKPGKLASQHVLALSEDLARFMRNFTGRGYDVSRETMAGGDSRFVREPGHDAFGLKVFADGDRVLIGRVAILEDETIYQSYVRHLKSLTAEEVEKPKVKIDLPDDFSFGAPDVGKEQGPNEGVGEPEDKKDK
jgi:hypothetical protein